MNTRIGVLCVVLGFTMVEAACAQQRIEHNRPKFSLRVPPGFTSKPATPPTLYHFEKQINDTASTVILIVDAHRAFSPRELTADDFRGTFPPGGELLVEPRQIQGGPSKGARLVLHTAGVRFTYCAAEVAVADTAIQIVVGGAAAYEGEHERCMNSVLMSFKGVPPTTAGGVAVGVRPMSAGERVLSVGGGGLNVLGCLLLLAYGVYRLCLIGRTGRFIQSRRKWLAIAGTMIFLGAVFRGMRVVIYHRIEEVVPVLAGLIIGLMLLCVRSWIKPLKPPAAAPQAGGIPVAEVPVHPRTEDSPQDAAARG
ncbi:MAG: hypothetical protein JXB13_09540 [Phycisphaerae bacterium]|nr:hypothetical protein [Phycisphaerae bacterium]